MATCHFIEPGENLVILGPPGVGKSHRAGAQRDCAGLPGVLHDGRGHECHTQPGADGESAGGHVEALHHPSGSLPIDRTGANLFFPLSSRRDEKEPMMVTSHQSFGAWGEVLGDRVLATAILDRVLHHAITINIRGHSYRLKEKRKAGLLRVEEASPTTYQGWGIFDAPH